MADTKVSALNSLTKSTVATDDVLPIVDTSATETKKISYQELVQPLDSQFAIVDNADTTKKVAFQASGITSGNTRTLTVPDADTTIVGTDTTQTLTNKTLTSPQVNFGSDATGDTIYRTSGGVTTRLPIGTSGQIMQVSAAGIPEWATNPAAADASTTVKGVVEIATTAEITAGTSTGGTGAKLVVPADAVGTGASKIVQLDSSARLPAVDGSQLTNIVPTTSGKIGFTATDVSVGTSSSAEADLASFTVAANTLSTANAIRVRIFISKWERPNAGSDTVTLRFKYGSTTVASISSIPVYSVAVATGSGVIEAVLFANGTTSSQRGSLFVNLNANNSSGNGTSNTVMSIGTGTASEDSTASKTIKVTAQFSGSDSQNLITASGIVVEKIF